MPEVDNSTSKGLSHHVMVPLPLFRLMAEAFWGPGGPAYHGTETPLGSLPAVTRVVGEGGKVTFADNPPANRTKRAEEPPTGYHITGYRAVRDAAKKAAKPTEPPLAE